MLHIFFGRSGLNNRVETYYGPAVSLKSWRYQRGGNVQRHLNCVFVA